MLQMDQVRFHKSTACLGTKNKYDAPWHSKELIEQMSFSNENFPSQKIKKS
jgi:hypothetical protein